MTRALGAALAAGLALVAAAAPAAADDRRPTKTEERAAGGTHWRVKSEHGAIHVWVPDGYDRATAGTVVYVHGYWTDADGAWKRDALARQFHTSGQNALFIVPEAPSGPDDSVKWDSLVELRRTVARANIRLPDGPTVVVGHSGAYRTISAWVDNKLLSQVILLDALYGRQQSFDEFIGTGKRAQHHKLLLIGSDTAAESRAFLKRYPRAVLRDSLPAAYEDLTPRERKSRLVYIRSQYSHSALASGGKALPLVLRLTPLRRL
ncbi:MAG TPA: hypothetical protein VMZ28_29860 [Kofleriaceae bacterium]|nr:hypothetical protein [Kofleriaceae bacterium]